MNVLAFDLGSHVGWAALHEGRLQSGAWDNPARYADCPGRFFTCFRTWLADMAMWHRPDLVGWEFTPHGASIHATVIHFGLVTRVQECAYRMEAQTAFIYPSSLKKFTTGDGRAEKPAMIAAMRKRWKWKGSNPDDADALAVLAWVIEKHKEQMA